MSMTVWLNVRTGKKYKSTDDDLSALFAQQEALDALAVQLNVTPLTAFFDDTDVRYNMDETGEFEESDDGWPADAAVWHEAASLLRTAQVLRDNLLAGQQSLPDTEGWSQQNVIDDLETLIPGLQKAAAKGSVVHLLVVM
jgi:hypothetical protein